jgi:hypothetical protein
VKTGKDVIQNGIYASNCCLIELTLQRRNMFPRCPKCMKLTRWELTRIRPIRQDEKAA